MKGIKITPTLAKALAQQVVDKIQRVRKEEDEKLDLIIRERKDYKRLLSIDQQIAELNEEKEKIIRVIKAEYHPRVNNISRGFYDRDAKYNISFNHPWVNAEVVKNQILLAGTFTNDSVDTLVGDMVAEHLNKG